MLSRMEMFSNREEQEEKGEEEEDDDEDAAQLYVIKIVLFFIEPFLSKSKFILHSLWNDRELATMSF